MSAPKKTLIKPIIINNRKMYINPPKVLTKVPFRSIQQYKDEIIYSSPTCDFLKGESQEVVIVNRMNLLSKSCRTVARCTSRGICVETTSDNVVATIGQKNYETVLSALSSVFNEETKVRGILALLSVQKSFNTTGTQSSMEITKVKRDCVSAESQTDDTRLNLFTKEKQRRRVRRAPLAPYVVTDKLKKFVVNPCDVKKDVNKKKAEEQIQQYREKSLPELKDVLDEDSNISCVSNLSASSWPSLPGILENTDKFLNQIDKVTDKTLNSTEVRLRDGSVIMIPVKPEDEFHIATPEVLKNVTHEERMKLIWHQAFIDFKLCLEQDEDGYYPLHIAVLNKDVDLVRRQCAALRARHESVDIPADGLTALHMAVRQNVPVACTSILLQHGADPLLCDHERRCSLHLAAEMDSPQLRTLLAYCDKHARTVLKNNLYFWRPELESKSDKELTRFMFNCITEMFDDQGYSPLMIAAEAAIPLNVSLLASRAGPLIDAPSPDCGATALYRAVARACLHAKDTGNTTTTPDKYLKTIEILVEHGGDPSIENQCGSSVNTLLTEFNICSLSMTIANKMTALKHGPFARDKLNTILFKNNDGRIDYLDISKTTNTAEVKPRTVDTGLHAVITIDIPAKKARKSNSNASTSDSRKSVPNIDVLKLNDNKINCNEININKLNELPTETAQDLIMQQVKLGNIIIKPKADVNINDDDTKIRAELDRAAALRVHKVNLKDFKDGSRRSNFTFKKLSSGKMIAITKTKPPGVSPPNSDRKFNLIKVKSSKPTVNNDTIVQKNIISPRKSNEFDEERSEKDVKTDKVVIVENVPVKTGFPIPNMTPGSSKTAKASDIVISPKISPKYLSKNLEFKEQIMDDISPKLTIGGKDVETMTSFRKRKLITE